MKRIGKIGIFWVYQDTVLARPIALEDGDAFEGWIDSPEGHVHVWDEVNAFSDRFPELAGRDYEEVPRGRVLYDQTEGVFVVYVYDGLLNPKSQAAIRKAFGLTKKNCRFEMDDHYSMDAGTISAMFDDFEGKI